MPYLYFQNYPNDGTRVSLLRYVFNIVVCMCVNGKIFKCDFIQINVAYIEQPHSILITNTWMKYSPWYTGVANYSFWDLSDPRDQYDVTSLVK